MAFLLGKSSLKSASPQLTQKFTLKAGESKSGKMMIKSSFSKVFGEKRNNLHHLKSAFSFAAFGSRTTAFVTRNNKQSNLFFNEATQFHKSLGSLGQKRFISLPFLKKKDPLELPQTAEQHAEMLKSWNKEGKHDKVQQSFERDHVPRNEDCVHEYITALAHTNKLKDVNVDLLLQKVRISQAVHLSSGPTIALVTNPSASSTNLGEQQQQQQQQQQNYQNILSVDKAISVRLEPSFKNTLFTLFGTVLAFALIIALWSYFNNSEGEKKHSGMQIANAHTEATNVKEKFDDVKGIDEVRGELEQIVDYLKNPKKYTRLGAKLPRGILLTGEPGTGKTLLARAIAGEAGVSFLYCSGSAFDELFVGVGPKRVRALFEDARAVSPCIIFIDEIDAMGMSRRYSFGSSYAKESTLNQLLTEMDGFKQNEGIIVIGATNIPEALDPALTRPGRFDKAIAVPMPDIKARKEILELYLNKIQKGEDVNSEKLAKRTPRFSGANLANLVNQAAIKAAIKNLPFVDMQSFEESLDEILMGVRHKNLTMLKKEIKRTAFHEAGHTLCQLFTEGAMPLYKVTIIPRGRALGVTVGLPDTDEVSHSRQELFAHMVVAMGGKVAEEIIFGENDVSGGCRSDLKSATNLAKMMITQYGMSEKLGNVFYNMGNIEKNSDKISDFTQRQIDEEIIRLNETAYRTAKETLKKKEKELHLLAEALLENETLEAEQVKQIIANEKVKVNKGNNNNNSDSSNNSSNNKKKEEREEDKKPIPTAALKSLD